MDDQHINSEIAICYSCKKQLDFEARVKISRQEECVHCKVKLHCCKMCNFYSTLVYNECREPNAERMLDKERANFCDYFELNRNPDAHKDNKEDLKSAADMLFKN